MAAFVSFPVAAQAPRLVPSTEQQPALALSAISSNLGGSIQEGSFVASAALLVVAAVSALRSSRRRSRRATTMYGNKRLNGSCWEEYKWRAKPGAKYRYRTVSDKYTSPEWGAWPNEEKGRLIKYGKCMDKGTVRIPEKFEDLYEDWFVSGSNSSKGDAAQGALLLDCDGTLVETERDGHRVAFNKAFKEKGFDIEWDVTLYGELLTTGGGKERMTRYFTDYNKDAWTDEEPPSKSHPIIKELHELKTELFMDIVKSGELSLREGIKELLTAASTAGWRMAVCSTSNEASVCAVVETLLPDFADKIEIFAGDVVSAKKPDPAVYNLACKELGVAAMKCVVIEDTEIGAASGKAAGMKVIVTKSVYSAEEEFGDADLVVGSASNLDFEEDVEALLPMLQLA